MFSNTELAVLEAAESKDPFVAFKCANICFMASSIDARTKASSLADEDAHTSAVTLVSKTTNVAMDMLNLHLSHRGIKLISIKAKKSEIHAGTIRMYPIAHLTITANLLGVIADPNIVAKTALRMTPTHKCVWSRRRLTAASKPRCRMQVK